MEDLLKLLFSNFYVVIIIVGFLLTMLNKARGKQNPGGNRMPTFGGGPNDRRQPAPSAERPQPERTQQQPAPARQRPAGQRAQAAPSGAESPRGGSLYASQPPSSGEGVSAELAYTSGQGLLARALEEQKLAASQPKPSGDPMYGASQPKRDSFRAPRGNDLRQAFIMAEVLGPPRSKKPLRQK